MERGFDVCSPRGGRHSRKSNWSMATIFLSTPSARRATAQHGVTQCPLQISTHALREEGDGIDRGIKDKDLQFLSTPSARRATILAVHLDDGFDISIHALREEGDALPLLDQILRLGISIHALREEGDYTLKTAFPGISGISIHALREEGDAPAPRHPTQHTGFLSTPSARRATVPIPLDRSTWEFLSTPSARRATSGDRGLFLCAGISIHALREEGDAGRVLYVTNEVKFLSTPSARRAT